ncbi:MAG: hypothetical protein ACO391_10455, partial [Pseudomonadales bacterium]
KDPPYPFSADCLVANPTATPQNNSPAISLRIFLPDVLQEMWSPDLRHKGGPWRLESSIKAQAADLPTAHVPKVSQFSTAD